jgi:hypothetical protein
MSMTSAAFHFRQYYLREPRLLPLLVFSGVRPSSSGLIRELIWAAPLLVCSVIAMLAGGVAPYSLMILVILVNVGLA